MIRILALFVIMVSMAPSVSAQQVSIRTGEHGAFTRLVFYHPREAEWQLIPNNTGYRLKFSSAITSINLSGAFQRIGRNRISALRSNSNQNSVDIFLSCNCAAEANQYLPGVIVIDIRPGGSRSFSVARNTSTSSTLQFEQSMDATWLLGRTDEFSLDQKTFDFGQSPDLARLALPLSNTAEIAASPRVLPRQQVRTANSSPALSSEETHNTASRSEDFMQQQTRIKQAENRLLDQLSRAISQGLVDPVENDTPFDPLAGFVETTERLALSGNTPMRVETSVDREISLSDELTRLRGCLPRRYVDLAEWTSWHRFSADISEAQSNFAAAQGREPEILSSAAQELAQRYLYWGFGAEAKEIAAHYMVDGEARNSVSAIAEIIDNGYSTTPNEFSAHVGCEGPAALWGVMARLKPDFGREVNSDEVVSAFNRLPEHLRNHLGPKLSSRLIALNQTNAAHDIVRILERSPNRTEDQILISRAEINVATNQEALSEEELRRIALGNSETAPAALVDYTSMLISRDEIIEAEIIELLAVYASENRRSAIGEKLMQNQALALARTGRSEGAFDVFERLPENTKILNRQSLKAELYRIITDYEEDERFLRLALTDMHSEKEQLEDPLLNKIASRLIQLGFPDQAELFIMEEAETPEREERRVLRAEAAFALGRYDEINDILSGVDEPRATRLRAEATAQLRNHNLAQVEFDSIGETIEADAEALRGQNWERLENAQDPLLREIASVAGAENPSDQNSGSPSLERSRGLLSESAETRTVLRNVLERYQQPLGSRLGSTGVADDES